MSLVLSVNPNDVVSAASFANIAFGQANSSFGQANSSFGQANAAFNKANSALALANTSLQITSTVLPTNILVTGLFESANVLAASPASTQNIDVTSNTVVYYTNNTSTNWTLNIRGNSTTTLNSILAVGAAVTVVFMVTNSTTAYYQSGLTVDGTSVSPKWQNGSAPSAGNTSAVDVYAITLLKTAASTYSAFASLTKFA